MTDVPVVVVGAGPVGLTAALLLARREVPVLVLERHAAPYPLPRAVHLDDEVFRVLQDAGVADDVARISRPMHGMRLVTGRLRVVAEFPRDPAHRPNGWPQGSLFHQPDLEAALRAAVAREPLVEFRAGAEAVRLEQDDDGGVTVVVRDRVTGAEGPVRGAAVLGCDGANSTVRGLIGSSMRTLGPADRWLVVDAKVVLPAPAWPGVHQLSGPGRAGTFIPVTDERVRWEFRLKHRETAEQLSAPERVRRLLAPFGAVDVDVQRVTEYVFRAEVADRWRSGLVLLAGDAAHLTPPFIGQALGLGLRDVHQLVWKLADVLAGRAGEELLDTYQAERERHARALIRRAQLLGLLMTLGGDRAAAVRRVAVAVVRRLPGLAAAAVSSRTSALRRGPLVDRSWRSGRLAGSLVPQPEVLVDGRRCRLDDVLGPDWALLTAGGPELTPPVAGPVRVVRLGEGPGEVRSPELAAWLDGRSVLVRPDRIVAAVGSA